LSGKGLISSREEEGKRSGSFSDSKEKVGMGVKVGGGRSKPAVAPGLRGERGNFGLREKKKKASAYRGGKKGSNDLIVKPKKGNGPFIWQH